MSAGPEVSIIMPVRNVAASLDAALASVCSQATDASVEVIVVGWRVRETPARLAHQYYAYGRGKFTTLVRHPSSLHIRWLVPPTLVVSLAAGILLSRRPPGRIFLAVVGGSYALFLLVGTTILGSRVGMRLAHHVALALGIMHLSWGTGFLISAGRAALGRPPGLRRLQA